METNLVLFGRRYYDPSLGRWLTRDPLGSLDGVNDYAFVHNNPENLVDPDGLFSLQTLWRGFSEAALEYLGGVGSGTSTLVDLFKRYLLFLTDVSDQATYTGNQLIGPRVWNALGFYNAQHQSGVVGDHEVSDCLRFSHINGIQNTHEDALRAVTMIGTARRSQHPLHLSPYCWMDVGLCQRPFHQGRANIFYRSLSGGQVARVDR